ncbi:MAG TPA: TRAP transporter small permease subunit [Gammaproteobacteria bacterium]|nr:TRAP transporter small permease subunit [Gammaproteobacteria bacterium]
MSDVAQNRWWARVDRAARALETWLIVIVLAGLILLGAAQIVLRNAFSIGFAWGDGLARLSVLWLGLLGALAASRDGRHITMGALARVLPPKLRVAAGVCADVFGAAVSAALAYVSWRFVGDSREFGDTMLGDLPAWWFQAIMPVAFALIAWQFLMQAVKRLRGGFVAESPL